MQGKEPSHRDESVPNVSGPFHAVSRYDILLAVIPVSFLATLVAAWFLPVPTRMGLTVGSLVCSLAVLDALFVNPPRPGSPGPLS